MSYNSPDAVLRDISRFAEKHGVHRVLLVYEQISTTTVANCCFWTAIFPTIWAFMETTSSFSSIVRFYF